jgi:diguanylate cyclase (GGDEF)-like protein
VRDIGKEWYVEPKRRDEFRAILKRDGYVHDFVSEIYRHKTRERIWITESARIVYDKSTGEPLFYEGSVREITETRRKLQAEELLRKLSSQVPGGLFQFIRLNGGCYATPYVSSGFRSLLGLDPDQDIEHPERFIDMIDAEDTALVKESLRVSGINMEAWHVEFRATAKDGKTKWLRIVAKPESIENGIIWHGYINDISLHKRHEMEIENLAFYDPLTGLPNRRMFMDRMAKAIACCNEQRNCSALIFIDLDNFKTLNDTRGHDVGDEYLTQVAKRLCNCVSVKDTVARIGGDEFVVILEGIGGDGASGSRAAIMAANRVLAALRDEFQVGEFSHNSSASVGVVVFDGREARPEEVLKHADIAMYRAKAAGRNGMAFYEPTPTDEDESRARESLPATRLRA